jgi:hypothetical protein
MYRASPVSTLCGRRGSYECDIIRHPHIPEATAMTTDKRNPENVQAANVSRRDFIARSVATGWLPQPANRWLRRLRSSKRK